MISFFSTSCGIHVSDTSIDSEGSLPAIMLTFDTTEGLVCVINVSVPELSKKTSKRMLKAYLDAATKTKAETILIGGVWTSGLVFTEKGITQHELELKIHTNEKLCVLIHSQCIEVANAIFHDG